MRPTVGLLSLGFVFGSICCNAPSTTPFVLARGTSDWEKGFRRPNSIEEAERKHSVTDPRLGKEPVPFGFIHTQWLKFKSQILPTDILMEFYEPPPPGAIHGTGGLEILRNGKIIDTLITLT
jgi:hypothetical protein